MSILEERRAVTREKRLGTISHFHGTIETIKEQAEGAELKQRVRTFTQAGPDEIISALSVLLTMPDAAVIVHGAVGCANAAFALAERGARWYTTALNERDTILGGDEKLRSTVLRAYEERRPAAIFLVLTPVVAINNDDVQSVILELSEEVPIPILSIGTNGFQSKAAANGYDILSHAFLKYLVRSEKEKAEVLNLVSFSEKKEDLIAVLRLLRELSIPYRLLPRFAPVSAIQNAASARATVALSGDEGGYFAKELEAAYQVPYLATERPIGLRGTRKFLQKIAREFNKEAEAERLIEREEAALEPLLGKQPLTGKQVFLDFPFSDLTGLTELVAALGGAVCGAAVPDLDRSQKKRLSELSFAKAGAPFLVGNGQPFEKANVLAKQGADLYLGEATDVAFAAEYRSVPMSLRTRAKLGYDGVKEIADAVTGRKIEAFETTQALYRPAWLKRSGDWYVKMEEK